MGGRKKPVTVGVREFEKQGDAFAFFRAILWKYGINQRLDEEDSADVEQLFLRHKDHAGKTGAGVDHFVVMISDEGSRCFGVVRVNGTREGFSYKRCVSQIW